MTLTGKPENTGFRTLVAVLGKVYLSTSPSFGSCRKCSQTQFLLRPHFGLGGPVAGGGGGESQAPIPKLSACKPGISLLLHGAWLGGVGVVATVEGLCKW